MPIDLSGTILWNYFSPSRAFSGPTKVTMAQKVRHLAVPVLHFSAGSLGPVCDWTQCMRVTAVVAFFSVLSSSFPF